MTLLHLRSARLAKQLLKCPTCTSPPQPQSAKGPICHIQSAVAGIVRSSISKSQSASIAWWSRRPSVTHATNTLTTKQWPQTWIWQRHCPSVTHATDSALTEMALHEFMHDGFNLNQNVACSQIQQSRYRCRRSARCHLSQVGLPLRQRTHRFRQS